MTPEQYDPFTENIPAYVLGTLSRAEASALKVHLETCQACQAELAHYQQIGDGLMAAVLPLRIPSPAVRRKLLERLEARTSPSRSKTKWSFRQFAVGTMAVLLIGTNLVAFLQIQDLRQGQLQLISQLEQHHTILGLLTANTEIHPINGDSFSGNLLLDREKNLSFLLVWNLPSPPNNHIYQIWLISPEGERIDAGLFQPEGDRPFTSAALTTSRSFADYVGIEVTMEPPGGSETPTGQQILSVDY